MCITEYGGWQPDGGNTSSNHSLQLKNYNLTSNLKCNNLTDQFALSNNKAKLTYPVALATQEDLYNVTNHTVSQWISHLEKKGYIQIDIIRNDKKSRSV